MTKIVFWVFTFTILTSYTLFVLSGGNTGVQYAHAMEQFNGPIIELNGGNSGRFDRIINRLQMRADGQRVLCEVDDETFDTLDLTPKIVEVDGEELTVYQSSLSEEDLSRNARVHCVRLEAYERILLLVSTHVS